MDEAMKQQQAILSSQLEQADRTLVLSEAQHAVLARQLATMISDELGGRIACSRRRRLYRLRAWLARKLAP